MKKKSLKKIKSHQRPCWDQVWIEMADTISHRATCDRGRSGCVIVNDDNRLLTTGYVGSPPGMPHCDDVGHKLVTTIDEDGNESVHCFRTIHAEQNAILQAAINGISIKGATLYCRMTPCRNCAMYIIACGIKRVVCEKKYRCGSESEQLFLRSRVSLVFMSDEIQKYTGEK